MANYLNNIVGVPAGINCTQIANAVYDELRKPVAIHDLALPNWNENEWPLPNPSVNVNFIQFEDPLIMPVSNTIFDVLQNIWTCNVTFVASDLQCLAVIEGRLAHELTHGIRSSLVHNYNAVYPQHTPYLIITPSKPPKQRQFRSQMLFGMTESRFCSGYWVEHKLFRGVVVALYGLYCTKDPVTNTIANNPIAIPSGGLFFRITHEGGDYPIHEKTYRAKYGSIFDVNNGTFGVNTVIYHFGKMVTRGNSHH